jgi:hypothetical protein
MYLVLPLAFAAAPPTLVVGEAMPPIAARDRFQTS